MLEPLLVPWRLRGVDSMLTVTDQLPEFIRHGVLHGFGLGRQRLPAERTIAWLHQFRRLRTRWERRADIHEAFLALACCLVCERQFHGG